MRTCSTLLGLTMLASLTACPAAEGPNDDASSVGDDTGTDTDTDTDTDTGTDTGEATVEVVDLATEHLGYEQSPAQLSAVANGGGVDVVHTDHWDNCCFMPVVTASVGDQVVDLSYQNLSEPCDCECSWELSYRLEGLDSGTWTVQIGDLSAEVSL